MTDLKNNEVVVKSIEKYDLLIKRNTDKISEIKKSNSLQVSSEDKMKNIKAINEINKNTKKIKSKFIYKIGVMKNDRKYFLEQVEVSKTNLEKLDKIKTKAGEKLEKFADQIEPIKTNIKYYKEHKSEFAEAKKYIKQVNSKNKNNEKLELKIKKLSEKSAKLNNLVEQAKFEMELFKNESIVPFEKEHADNLKNSSDAEKVLLQKDYDQVMDFLNVEYKNYEVQYNSAVENLDNCNNSINEFKNTIDENLKEIESIQTTNGDVVIKMNKVIEDKKTLLKIESIQLDIKLKTKAWEKAQKELNKKTYKLEMLDFKISRMANIISIEEETIPLKEGKAEKAFNTVERILLKDWFFIVISTLLSAGVVLATYLFIEAGVGAFNEIVYVAMIKQGLDTGDFTPALAFAVGFLIARVLEGPLTGILDIGGAIMSGVGLGIPAVFLSTGKIAWMMHNPFMALVIGAAAGLLIGIVIMVVRVLKPKDIQGIGTDIMIGAGNATGKFLGPLVIISAAMFNPITGIGAAIGAAAFMWIKKPIVGGAIIGAMLFGIIPAFL